MSPFGQLDKHRLECRGVKWSYNAYRYSKVYHVWLFWCREVSRSRGFAVLVVSLLIWMIRGKNWRCFCNFSDPTAQPVNFVTPVKFVTCILWQY